MWNTFRRQIFYVRWVLIFVAIFLRAGDRVLGSDMMSFYCWLYSVLIFLNLTILIVWGGFFFHHFILIVWRRIGRCCRVFLGNLHKFTSLLFFLFFFEKYFGFKYLPLGLNEVINNEKITREKNLNTLCGEHNVSLDRVEIALKFVMTFFFLLNFLFFCFFLHVLYCSWFRFIYLTKAIFLTISGLSILHYTYVSAQLFQSLQFQASFCSFVHKYKRLSLHFFFLCKFSTAHQSYAQDPKMNTLNKRQQTTQRNL